MIEDRRLDYGDPNCLGLGLPQFGGPTAVTSDELCDTLALAEQAGFDAVWVGEGLFSSYPSLDPLMSLAFAAARSRSLRLGVATLVLPHYEPVLLARAAATLDWLSQGRLILGLSLGVTDGPHEAFGIGAGDRRERFEEYMLIMRRLLSQDSVTVRGSFRSLTDLGVHPHPVQPSLPLWLGGSVPAAIDRAARLGDGWLGSATATIDSFASQIELLRGALTRHGRGGPFSVGKKAFVAIDQAPRDVADWFSRAYGRSLASFTGSPDDPMTWVLAGRIDSVTDELLTIRRAGARTLIMHPVGLGFDRQASLLASHALPALRSTAADG